MVAALTLDYTSLASALQLCVPDRVMQSLAVLASAQVATRNRQAGQEQAVLRRHQ